MSYRPQFYTVNMVAEMLAVSPRTIRRWINEGKLEAQKVGTRRKNVYRDNRPVRIPVSALKKMLEPKGNA